MTESLCFGLAGLRLCEASTHCSPLIRPPGKRAGGLASGPSFGVYRMACFRLYFCSRLRGLPGSTAGSEDVKGRVTRLV
jgi:hypothetical protein